MKSSVDVSGSSQTAIEFWQIKPILFSVAALTDIDEILAKLGFPKGLEGTPKTTPVTLPTYFRIQRDIARSLNDLTLHLSSRKLTYETGDYVLNQLKRAQTLQDTIRGLCDYFNMMHGDTYNSMRQTGDSLTLIVDDSSFPYTLKEDGNFTHFVGDCVLIKVHCLLDSLSNGLAGRALKRVGVQRSRTEPGGLQNRFWDVSVSYGNSVYKLVYDYHLACQAIKPPEEIDFSAYGIFARVIDQLERLEPLVDPRAYKDQVLDLIKSGVEQQAAAAQRLSMSVATLRRRLVEEQTSFRELVHSVRLERALALLKSGRSVVQVAEELDYSDIRAFNRAFKKWMGITPSVYSKEVMSN